MKSGPVYSKHGFVLVSINQVLYESSIMKSNPNSSNVFSLFNGSTSSATALN